MCIEKLTEGKTTKNDLYAKIKILNSLSNDSIVAFEKVIDIPFIYSTNGIDRMVGENFTKIADRLADEKINDGENTLKTRHPSFITEITKENITNTEESVISAMAYWYMNNLNSKADKGSTDAVVDSITNVININTKSRTTRKNHFAIIKAIWKLDECNTIK